MASLQVESGYSFEFLGTPDPSFDAVRLQADVSAIVRGVGVDADAVGSANYLKDLRSRMRRDEKSGSSYLLVEPDDPSQVSPERLIVLPTPFGKSVRELVVLAMFMCRLGNVLADDQGRKPRLLLAGPPRWSSLPTGTKEELYHGELGGLAGETLDLISRIPELRQIGLIAGIGFSYAASLTSAIGCRADSKGYDMMGMAMASPGDTVKRPRLNLFLSFGSETRDVHARPYRQPNPPVFNEANDVGDVEFWYNLVREAPQNLRLMAALAVGKFMDRIGDFGRRHPDVPTTVTHGSSDLITPHLPICTQYGELSGRLGPSSKLRWLVAAGARHPWGHNATMLGIPVRYGFERMATGQ